MKLYTEELKQKLRDRCNNRRHHDQHSLYTFVSSPQLKPVRDRIERWVDEFPELASNKDFLNRFVLERSHKHAISELVTGIALKRFGFNVERDKKIEGKTPDWYASGKKDIADFIVEVTTINPPDTQQRVTNKLNEFFDAVRRLRIGVTLLITMVDSDADQKFQLNEKKKNVELIRQWLITNPAIGSTFCVNGFQFEVLEWNPTATTIGTTGVGRTLHVDPTLFEEPIKSKLRNYERLITNNRIPFWVAIQTDERVGLRLEVLEEMLSGRRRALAKWESMRGRAYIQKVLSPQNLGLFEKFPLLSGLLWIDCDFLRNYWNLVPYYNPFAMYPLPVRTLTEIRFLPRRDY